MQFFGIEEPPEIKVFETLRHHVGETGGAFEESRIDRMNFEEIEADLSNQFALVKIAEQNYAVALTYLREIIETPKLVPVPGAHASLVGLSNLRGNILSVMDPAVVLRGGISVKDHNTRVLVCQSEYLIGISVSQLQSISHVSADDIEEFESTDCEGEDGLIERILRFDNELYMILEIPRLLERGFGSKKEIESNLAVAPKKSSQISPRPISNAYDDEDQLYLGFRISGEEFAIPVTNVQEIIQKPENKVKPPIANPLIPEILHHRDRILNLVDLKYFLELSGCSGKNSKEIVIVQADDNHHYMGLMTDKVTEVISLSEKKMEPLPSLIKGADTKTGIASVCQHPIRDQTLSIVSIDDLASIIKSSPVAAEDSTSEISKDKAVKSDTKEEAESISFEKLVVVFRLGSEEYGIPIGSVQEIISHTGHVTKIPNAASWLEGVINFRGAVLPMINTRLRFHIAGQEVTERIQVVVVNFEHTRCGFIVDEIKEVFSYTEDKVIDAPTFSENTISIVSKVINIEECNRIILLLDPGELMDAAHDREHSIDTAA